LSSLTRGQAGGAAPVSLRAVTVALAQPRSPSLPFVLFSTPRTVRCVHWSTHRSLLEYL
jgi:hypothetical protein